MDHRSAIVLLTSDQAVHTPGILCFLYPYVLQLSQKIQLQH